MQIIRTEEEITKELVIKLVTNYKETEVDDLNKKYDYYKGDMEILKRKKAKNTGNKPNNTIVNNFAKYIVDIIRGYFVGNPPSYNSDNEEYMAKLQEYFDLNDEQDENHELAGLTGIHGWCYEIVFADENNNIRFNEVYPQDCILVYNNSIIPEPRFAIRFYENKSILTGKSKTIIEVYTADDITTYEEVEKEGDTKETEFIQMGEPEEHYLGEVPVIEFINNEERMGDFEAVMSLIDAYNNAASNKLNDLDYFSDAYMYIVGHLATDKDDIGDMKDNRLILLKEKGQAGFLTKPSNNQDSEDIQNRIQNDIHKFSFVPDLSDQEFSSNSSGVAMEYKHFGLDQIVSNKERKFKTGLMKRVRLMTNYINHMNNTNYDPAEINITFKKNKPINQKEAVEMAEKLKNIISLKSTVETLPMVENPEEEMVRIEEENDPYSDMVKGNSNIDLIFNSLQEQAEIDKQEGNDPAKKVADKDE